ncbi:MAG: restriction endonuclease subunit S, partial [Sphingobacterium sp.]
MSKIEELIAQYCPDGVEYRELGEVCEFKRGRTITAKSAVEGDVPVIAGGQKPSYFHNEANRTGETISVSSSGAYAGFVNFWTIPVFLSDSFSVDADADLLKKKYVFYYLKSKQEEIHHTKKGSGVPHVHGSSISKFPIPIPPLPVQEEIVRILDKFTALEAELEAELEARTRQYEYYRDQLLSFEGKGVEWKTLGDVSIKISSGGTPKTSNSLYYNGEIPWLRTQEVNFGEIWDTGVKITLEGLKNSSAKMIPENCVIIAMYGATVGKSAINKIPLSTNQACANIQVNPEIASYRFVFHWVHHNYEKIKALGTGSQTNIN